MKKSNPELGKPKNYQLAPKSNEMFEKFYQVQFYKLETDDNLLVYIICITLLSFLWCPIFGKFNK